MSTFAYVLQIPDAFQHVLSDSIVVLFVVLGSGSMNYGVGQASLPPFLLPVVKWSVSGGEFHPSGNFPAKWREMNIHCALLVVHGYQCIWWWLLCRMELCCLVRSGGFFQSHGSCRCM